MAATVSIPEVLRSLGADPEEVLGEIGYDLTIFQDPENRISYAIRNRIIQHCATRTDCPHFGLAHRPAQRTAHVRSRRTAGEVRAGRGDRAAQLRSLSAASTSRAPPLNLAVEGNTATLTWHVDEPGMEAIDHIGDATLATLCNIMHELCGTDWRPTEVWFAHRMPLDAGPYRRFFRVPLALRRRALRAVVLRRTPEAPLARHRRRSAQSAGKGDRFARGRYRDDFPAQVRSVLRPALMTGQHQGRAGRRAPRHAQPHAESPPQRLRRRLPATPGRDALRDRAADARIFGHRGRRDLRVARLCRARRVHEGVPALERHDARAVATGSRAPQKTTFSTRSTNSSTENVVSSSGATGISDSHRERT